MQKSQCESEMSAKEAVDNLYNFRDNYFKTHKAESASQKIDDLTSELDKTLNFLNTVIQDENCTIEKAECDLLRAKALNVLPAFNPEALEILTKLVKFHPKMVEGWNELGSCFWKKSDNKAAKSCYESALREEKNPESLRRLSMLLRQVGRTPEEKLEKTLESLEKAKEAVNINIKDGRSWYVLGNAYLSLFFSTNQSPSLLKQCLYSYNQAFADETAKNNPDLYYNWAMALKYDESYCQALENLEKAQQYDPFWPEIKEQLDILIKHLENTQLMISKKGKCKPKKVKEYLSSLQKESAALDVNETFVDKKGQPVVLKRCKFSELQVGLNAGSVLRGKVVCDVYCTDSPAFTFCMIDEEETCFSVNVYNLDRSKRFAIGDSIAIFQPFVQHFNFTYKDKKFSFSSARVNNPLQLEVNKKRLRHEMVAAPKVKVTLKS